jgi:hypothetical protein
MTPDGDTVRAGHPTTNVARHYRSHAEVTMPTVETTDDTLHVSPRGWGRLVTLGQDIRVPIAAVDRAYVDRDIARDVAARLVGMGLRVWIPRRRFAADQRRPGGRGRELWDVRLNDDAVLVIDLTGEPYGRLILSVDDPHALAERLT